jgi:hypothetical protein
LIDSALTCFSPISLNEMDSVLLMDRVDTKYIFSTSHLSEVLGIIPSTYKILEIKKHRNLPYRTIYLDTNDFLFYQEQMRGKLNIHKVRYRIYESTDTSFLEVKFKSNKMRTIKWRISHSLQNYSIDKEAISYLSEFLTVNSASLRPTIISKFDRITLARLETKERITVDTNISFSSIDGSQEVTLPYLAILESKHNDISNRSSFVRLLKNLNVRSLGFSKYCIGSAMLFDLPRQNDLKPKYRILQKIATEFKTFDKNV